MKKWLIFLGGVVTGVLLTFPKIRNYHPIHD